MRPVPRILPIIAVTIGGVLAILSGFLMEPLLTQGSTWGVALFLCIELFLLGVTFAPMGALLPELFPTHVRYTGASAAYNLGVARLSAQYQMTDQTNGLEDSDMSIGVTVPFGNFDVSAGYARGKSELNGATTGKGSAFALGATYALSKRTKLYGGLLDGDVEDGTGATARERRLYAVGVRHDF